MILMKLIRKYLIIVNRIGHFDSFENTHVQDPQSKAFEYIGKSNDEKLNGYGR